MAKAIYALLSALLIFSVSCTEGQPEFASLGKRLQSPHSFDKQVYSVSNLTEAVTITGTCDRRTETLFVRSKTQDWTTVADLSSEGTVSCSYQGTFKVVIPSAGEFAGLSLQDLEESISIKGERDGTESDAVDVKLAYDVETIDAVIEQQSGQSDPVNTLPISFSINFSKPIDPSTFDTADIEQTGSASSVTWALTMSDEQNWTLTATAAGSDGTVVPSMTAGVVSSDGEIYNAASTSTDNSVLYDTTAPAAPNDIILSSPTSSPGLDSTPDIEVRGVSSNDSVTLFSDSSCASSVANGVATDTSITLTTSTLSPDGNHSFYAKAEDEAGNSSPCSTASLIYTLDTQAPTASLSNTPGEPSNITSLNVDVAGTDLATYAYKVTSGDATACSSSTGYSADLNAATNITYDVSGISDGLVTICAVGKDSAGNIQAYASATTYTWTKDTSQPSVTITSDESGSTNLSPIPVTINFSEGVTGFLVGDLTVGNGTASNFVAVTTSQYTADITPTTDGTVSVDVTANVAQDSASNNNTAATQFSVTYDSTAPALPTGLTLSSPSTSPGNDTTPSIQVGGLTSGDTVYLYSDTTCVTQVASGTASATTLVLTSSALTEGSYEFHAKAEDPAGNTSACSTDNVSYEVDLTAPSAPSSLSLNDPASSPGTDTTPSIDIGGIVSGDEIYLYSDATCSTAVANATAGGTTITLTSSALSEGTYEFHAMSYDSAGNISTCSSASVTYELDLTAPSAPTGLALNTPSTSPGNDQTPSIDISGVTSGDNIYLYSDSACTTQVVMGTASGTSITLTSSLLSAGTYEFHAKAIDSTGNASACSTASVSYEVDLSAPGSPTGLTLNTPSSSPNNNQTPSIDISGVVSGDEIHLYSDSTCTTQVANGTASGTSITLSSNTLSEGIYEFHAKAVDPAGNESACSTANVSYEVDLTAPSPSSLTLNSPASSPSNVDTPSIEVSGISSGDIVTLYSDLSCVNNVASGTSSGTSIVLASSALIEGTYEFHARVEDPAGNLSSCSTAYVTYELDLTAPSAPTGLSLSTPSSSPSQDTTPSIEISGVTSGDHIYLYSGASLCTTLLVDGVASGTSIILTSSALTEGTYELHAAAVDPAGNISSCSSASVAYEVDVTAPSTPTVTLTSPDSTPSNDTNPIIEISGLTIGDEVLIYSDSACGGSPTVIEATTLTLSYSFSSLADGTYEFNAQAKDDAGNISPCSSSVTYTVDTTPPDAPTGLDYYSPAISPNNDTTPTFKISGVTSGDEVFLYSDSTCTSQVSFGTSSDTYITLTTSTLTDGTYNFYAKAVDPAGNGSPCSSATISYELDTVLPDEPTAFALSSPTSSPGLDLTPDIEISGLTIGDVVTLYSDSSCISQVAQVNVTSSTMVLTSSALTAGLIYNFHAVTRDDAFNYSACSTASVSYNLQACPTNYVLVEGNSTYSTTHFCVMQYEAKDTNVDGVPDTGADGAVWGSINRDDAIAKCQAIGTGYDLILNNEWQTLTRNIESVAANWSGNAVGSGCLYQGNTGRNTTCSYYSSQPDNGTSRDGKAMLQLSNGQEIWDISGNVWEWQKDAITDTYSPNSYISTWSNSTKKNKFGPLGDYTSHGSGTYYAGLGYATTATATGGVLRGGSYLTELYAGAFAVTLSSSPTSTLAEFGFRCIYRP